MKRNSPLFIFDLTRQHKFGEVDFVSVTDKDNGFVAKISYLDGDINEADDNSKTVGNGHGTSARMEITQFQGVRRDNHAVRTLLAKAMAEYMKRSILEVDSHAPSDAELVLFMNILIRGNMSQLADMGSDVEGRTQLMTTLRLLEAAKNRIAAHIGN